ncbi:hypothetical protein VOI54_00070 [Tamlana sp. 2201CG12-4]|uniref:hypothetical protein n=1 Tax=Tamlana sp. 2201CG12-4 TaxID=3112582 RepID=UPI002DB5E6D0|nr:hypothetical protein [Tamlana sp. 2201CG12-4]MEC3905401.1 hypothetical protein [Tamlana sp. 2201CG12-4]
MLKQILFLFILGYYFIAPAQKKDSLSIKNGIENPNLLATHHFGIFSSRINTNFKLLPSRQNTLTIHYTSGNNFHPFVEAYFPKDPAVRERLSQTIWHDRSFTFQDQQSTPADYLNIVIDAVIKEFRINFNMPLAKGHELDLSLRSYLIGKGKHPFSLFTGDESIEWFHSNVAGGEDPYGRRYYGLNQVNFKYLDKNGNTLELNNNDFFIGGIELSHYYYPKLAINKSKLIFINFGSHLGINTTKFNASLDIGISANAVKKIILKNNYEFNAALGVNVLRKNLLDFKDDVIDLGNNKYLGTLESNVEITKHTKKGNFNAFGINFQMQTRYSKKEEANYYKLLGKWKEINGGWHNGVATLYKTLSNWNFVYTYGCPKFKLSIFVKEDFEVNNAPDFQTGLNLKLPVFN